MEGTPFLVESGADNEKERREQEEAEKEAREARAKKAEAFGILAVEPAGAEKEARSPLERALAATREQEPETEEKPAAEVAETEQEAPAEIIPEPAEAMEAAPSIPEQPEETEQEPEPAPPIETEPEPAAPIEAAPEPQPEAEPAEIPETKQEAAPEPRVESEPESESVESPAETVPIEKPETPPKDKEEKKKPGFIRSLFRRDKEEQPTEKTPEPQPEAEEPSTAEVITPDKPKEKPETEKPAEIPEAEPEEPEFHFNQTATPLEGEVAEKPQTHEAAPEAAKELEETEPERKAKPEQIGQMLLNTEASPVESQPIAEAAASSHEAEEKLTVEASPIEPASGKRVVALSREELLDLGANIEINGNSLRHAYETHLIGEGGLRRLIAEHLQGGDLPKALRREITEHEMDFERDPKLRDQTHASPELLENNTPVLDKLLENADVTMGHAGQQPVPSQALPQVHYGSGSEARHQSGRYRRLDIALVSVIGGLTFLIIIVLLVRR